MCFKNLPIEFDENGRAYLKEDIRDPYGLQRSPDLSALCLIFPYLLYILRQLCVLTLR